jgi:hypothetical protein
MELLGEAAILPGQSGLPDLSPRESHTGAERIICGFEWVCADALRVARCESGYGPDGRPDYYAEPWENPGHRGAFQLSYVHAPKFAAHGWTWETDGLILERNVAIAFTIWQEQGWRPWACAAVIQYE